MQLTVNGETHDYPEGTTLSTLIDSLGIKVNIMAAAVNMEVVKKEDWEHHQLQEGDRVELLHFVGGG
jgi:sulfur carrier protein